MFYGIMGEMLKEMPMNKGGNLETLKHVSTSNIVSPVDKIPTLQDMGIEKHESGHLCLYAHVSLSPDKYRLQYGEGA